ncbi:MAG: hypothetical protein EOO01_18115, partial [Chitinophagaceae bacterium]
MRKIILLIFVLQAYSLVAQPPAAVREINFLVSGPDKQLLPFATVSLLKTDSSLVKTLLTDSVGAVSFRNLPAEKYIARVSMINFQLLHTEVIDLVNNPSVNKLVLLQTEAGLMNNVTVTAKKPLVQFMPDKTVINVEAGITNAGATVMEVLEKSPGVTIDRDGNISLKGKAGVQVMIDGKLTQLSGADLQNLLSGMNASQVETIELMDNPPAKYDAAGNAGLINIRTKKIRQKGFNGTLTLAYGQGRLPKNNNSLILNYRNGDFNFFLTYSLNASRFLMDMYALRTYYKSDGTVTGLLEQPYKTRGTGYTHNLRTGMDYSLSKKTTLGLTFTGIYLTRDNKGNSNASWKNPAGVEDSVIYTTNRNTSRLKQGGLNFNARHVFNQNEELTADVDVIGYDIYNDQLFENLSSVPGSKVDASKGEIPSDIQIFSAKADYSKRFSGLLWEAGWKTSRVNTDNLAGYFYLDGNDWKDDLGKSNHFLYKEDIHALYSSADRQSNRWHFQAGLRYEYTNYKARQLGNAITKDSSFNRNYHSLFPTAFV